MTDKVLPPLGWINGSDGRNVHSPVGVDQNIHMAELADRLLEDGLDVAQGRDIRRNGEHFGARSQLPRNRLQALELSSDEDDSPSLGLDPRLSDSLM